MTTQRQKSLEGKRRVHHFPMMKQRGHKIAVVTAYDYPTAQAAEAGGADAILVGDSLGMVALGYDSTIPVTMDMMVHHAAAVRRGAHRPFLIVDMPFMSYRESIEQALRNAGRLVQEGGAEAVKLEGGADIAPQVRAIVAAGIPVMGHVGLTPQSVHGLGGYKVQGRHEESARQIAADAAAIAEAGAFSIVLEAMDPDLASQITESLKIPTIGIGASRRCDGQVLVLSDLLGLGTGTPPKFAKQYTNLFQQMHTAVREYCEDVKQGTFPEEQHEY